MRKVEFLDTSSDGEQTVSYSSIKEKIAITNILQCKHASLLKCFPCSQSDSLRCSQIAMAHSRLL